MKPLYIQAQDLRDTAQILLDQARSLEELAVFLGAAPPEKKPDRIVVRPPVVETSVPEPDVDISEADAKRILSHEEKEAVKAEYFAYPENQRTKKSRAALAAKYRCSIRQIASMTKSPEYYKKLSAGRWKGEKEAPIN